MMKGKTLLSPLIVIISGLVVLAGYLIDIPILNFLRTTFTQWALVVSGTALLVGIANLFLVHWRKAAAGEAGGFYSMVLIFSLLITLVVFGYFSPTSEAAIWMYTYLQVPVEASLMAILAVTLVIAAGRLLRRRLDLFSLVFVFTMVLVLLGMAPIFGVEIPGLAGPGGLRTVITQILSLAGARGLLLGIALGIIATGIRILTGVERPYGG